MDEGGRDEWVGGRMGNIFGFMVYIEMGVMYCDDNVDGVENEFRNLHSNVVCDVLTFSGLWDSMKILRRIIMCV